MKSRQSSVHCRRFCEISFRHCLVVVIQWPEHWQLMPGDLGSIPSDCSLFTFPYMPSQEGGTVETHSTFTCLEFVLRSFLTTNRVRSVMQSLSCTCTMGAKVSHDYWMGAKVSQMSHDYWMGAKVSHDVTRLLNGVTWPFHWGHDTHFKLSWTAPWQKNNTN